jgi:hypothetical protein
MSDTGQFGAIHADDIEELNFVVWPWELVMRQLSLGPLQANLEFLQLDGILINRERWSNRVVATGATPAKFIALAAPCTSRSFKWCGNEVGQSQVACGIDSTEIEFVTPEDADHWVILIPHGRIVDYLGEETAAEALSQRNIVLTDPVMARLNRPRKLIASRVRALFLGARGIIGRFSNRRGDGFVCRDDEPSLELVEMGRPWSFDGDGDLLRLVSEAYRINLAWLFDSYVAITTSITEPLPHQISAVYEEMLPRQSARGPDRYFFSAVCKY